MPVGLWDIEHCEEEPILDYNKEQANRLLLGKQKENIKSKGRKIVTQEEGGNK